MAEYKKICKFEATRNPSRWIITTLMDLESLNAAVKLMFDSTSELWPAVRKTGLWKNKFYFDFKFGVCEQVLAERVNRYNAQVHEAVSAEDGLEQSRVETARQMIDADQLYLLKTKCYSQILCKEDAARLLAWLNDGIAKSATDRTPLLRDGNAYVQSVVAAVNAAPADADISEIISKVSYDAYKSIGQEDGVARAPMYQNLIALYEIADTHSDQTMVDKWLNVLYDKTPIWAAKKIETSAKLTEKKACVEVKAKQPVVMVCLKKPAEHAVQLVSPQCSILVSHDYKAKSLLSRIMH